MNLVFRDEAISDLRRISRFSRRTYGKAQTKRYLEEIEHHCRALAAGRYHGRSADGVSPGLRKHLVASHIVFFRLLKDDLVIVRVLHGAMNHEDYF